MTERDPHADNAAPHLFPTDPFAPARRASTLMLTVGFVMMTFGGVVLTTATSLEHLRADPRQAELFDEMAAASNGVPLGVIIGIAGGLLAGYGLCLVSLGVPVRRGGLVWLVMAGVLVMIGGLVAALQTIVALVSQPAAVLAPGAFLAAAVFTLRALFAAFGNAQWVERRTQAGWAAPKFYYPTTAIAVAITPTLARDTSTPA